MAKYLLLKHYRGAPASINDVPMDQWTPEELSAHVQYMQDFAARLEAQLSCARQAFTNLRTASSPQAAGVGR